MFKKQENSYQSYEDLLREEEPITSQPRSGGGNYNGTGRTEYESKGPIPMGPPDATPIPMGPPDATPIPKSPPDSTPISMPPPKDMSDPISTDDKTLID